MRIAFTTLGCKINQYETEQLRQELLARGNTIVPFESEADVYVINTCTVTAKSDYQCRQAIRSAVRRKRNARVFVTGCYASVNPDQIREILGVERVVSNEDKSRIPDLLMKSITDTADSAFSSRFAASAAQIQGPDRLHPVMIRRTAIERRSERTRAFLKIQDGCNNTCTYCIVPVARGKSRSIPASEIVSAFDNFIADQCPEIVLTGIHIGTYGADLVPPVRLNDIMEVLISRRRSSRIRLSSIEANEITAHLVNSLGRGLCRHLHIPLQSGDDSILSAMKRNYNSTFYRGLISDIASKVPGVALGTDIIVGFPGEGEREFQNTMDIVQASPLSHFHVFTYSMRPGTPAASMKHQVPESLKKVRSEQLRAVARRKNLEFRRRFVGTELSVILESKVDNKTGLFSGLSDNYIRVQVKGAGKEHIGRELQVVLSSVTEKENTAVIL
jgi:threonylcarbamoyladenosine tRNA methylthiotransferase MtaB